MHLDGILSYITPSLLLLPTSLAAVISSPSAPKLPNIDAFQNPSFSPSNISSNIADPSTHSSTTNDTNTLQAWPSYPWTFTASPTTRLYITWYDSRPLNARQRHSFTLLAHDWRTMVLDIPIQPHLRDLISPNWGTFPYFNSGCKVEFQQSEAYPGHWLTYGAVYKAFMALRVLAQRDTHAHWMLVHPVLDGVVYKPLVVRAWRESDDPSNGGLRAKGP